MKSDLTNRLLMKMKDLEINLQCHCALLFHFHGYKMQNNAAQHVCAKLMCIVGILVFTTRRIYIRYFNVSVRFLRTVVMTTTSWEGAMIA